MTVAPLLEQLRRDAEDDAALRLATAREAAADRLAAAAARRAHRREEAIAAARREFAHARERRASDDTLEAARVTLAARARFVDHVLAACVHRAAAVVGRPGFARAMGEQLEAALACLPEDEIVISCPPVAAAVMRAATEARGARARVVEDPSLTPGFVAASVDGRVRVDATIAHQLALRRDRLAIDLVHALPEATA